MSCGSGCGGGGSPRIPSYISGGQRQRPPARPLPQRPVRPPAQNERTGVRPAVPYGNRGAVGNAPCPAASNPQRGREIPRAPAPVAPPRMPMNQTFARGSPQLNRTYVQAPPRLNETYNRPGRYPPVPLPAPRWGDTYTTSHDDSGFADSIMDDMGDGDEWNVSTAVSVEDFEDSGEETGEDEEFSYEDDNQPCVPCDDDDLLRHFPNINHAPQLDNIGPPEFYDSGNYLDNITPPRFANISNENAGCDGPCAEEGGEDSSLGLLRDELLQEGGDELNADKIHEIAESPSNISVFDAEELNRTTAPRNSDVDIPRNRIWQSLMNSLNESENAEDLEYEEFVAGLQQERREWMDRSRLSA